MQSNCVHLSAQHNEHSWCWSGRSSCLSCERLHHTAIAKGGADDSAPVRAAVEIGVPELIQLVMEANGLGLHVRPLEVMTEREANKKLAELYSANKHLYDSQHLFYHCLCKAERASYDKSGIGIYPPPHPFPHIHLIRCPSSWILKNENLQISTASRQLCHASDRSQNPTYTRPDRMVPNVSALANARPYSLLKIHG